MDISVGKDKKGKYYTKISFNDKENSKTIKAIKEKGILIKESKGRLTYKLNGNIFL